MRVPWCVARSVSDVLLFPPPGNKVAKILVVAFVLVLGIAPVATAVTVSYATASSPQFTSGYNSQARSYGTWSVYDTGFGSAYSGLNARYKLTNSDNHQAYVVLATTAKKRTSSASASTSQHSSHEHSVSSAWRSFSLAPWSYLRLPSAGVTDAKGSIKTCLDIPLRPDKCSSAKTISRAI